MVATTSIPAKSKSNTPFRVMVVDDSAIIRGFLSRYLSEDPTIDVVTTANNGQVALSQLKQHDIEVVVLDIEMPVMDGLTALPQMIEMKPDLQVVMASTLTRKNADISMKSLAMGAVDYVPKPETARSVNASIDFRRELVEKVKAWAARRRKRAGQALPTLDMGTKEASKTSERLSAGFVTSKRRPSASSSLKDAGAATARTTATARRPAEKSLGEALSAPRGDGKNIALRPASMKTPKILAIGSSTGGPQALLKFFEAFKSAPDVPILITQHMPATFTAILADHLQKSTGWECSEARNDMQVKAGAIYIAKGGLHMELEEKEGGVFVKLTDTPPENFCKPAVDPMLRSIVDIYGDRVLTVILTGMGHDGLKGGREVTKAGGTLLAQDEATSVVWGMPGAVATAGLCSEVSPLTELANSVANRLGRGQ